MTVIPYSTANFLFPGFDAKDDLPPVFTNVEVPEVFQYIVAGARHAEGIMVTTMGFMWHKDRHDNFVSVGGPLSALLIADRGEKDARGNPGVTLGCLFDLRGQEAEELMPYKVETYLRDAEAAFTRLSRGYDELVRCAGVPMGVGERLTLVEALQAQPHSEVADPDGLRKHMMGLRALVLDQAKLLLPVDAFARLSETDEPAITRDQLKHGEITPGGGATMLIWSPKKA